MRIGKIHINGFGIHANRTMELDEGAPVALFYGRNEAGKSTVMGFVRSILFGFQQKNHPERYQPVHGGDYGGYLLLHDGRGGKLRMERIVPATGGVNSQSAGRLRMINEHDGSQADEADLRRLTGGISAELYRSIFAFSLTELQELRSLQSDEISSYLFSTGMGVGGGAIMKTEKMLQQRMEQLFKPRGNKQEINRLLKEIEIGEAELRRSKESLGAYNVRMRELHETEQLLEAEQRRFRQDRESADWLEKCLKAWDDWLTLREIERELDELPAFPSFPEAALARFEKWREEADAAAAAIRSREQRREKIQHDLRQSEIDEKLIGKLPAIGRLMEKMGMYRENLKTLAELSGDIAHMKTQIVELIRRIDESWTEDDLRNLRLTVEQREQVRQFHERFEQARQERIDAENEHKAVQQKAQEHTQIVRRKQQTLDRLEQDKLAFFQWMKPANLAQFEQSWSALKQELEQRKTAQLKLEYVEQRIGDLQRISGNSRRRTEQRGKSGWLWRLAVSAGLALNGALPAYLLFVVKDGVSAAISFVILAALNALQWLPSHPLRHAFRGKNRWDGALEDANKELEQYTRQVEKQDEQIGRLFHALFDEKEAAAALADHIPGNSGGFRFSPETHEPWIHALEQAAEKWKTMLHESERAAQELAELSEAGDRIGQMLEQVIERQAVIGAKATALAEEWSGWLSERNLPGGLSAPAVMEILNIAEQGRQLMDQLEKRVDKRNELQRFHDQFARECAELAEMDFAADEDWAFDLRRMKEHAERHARLKDESEAKTAALRELENEIRLHEDEKIRANERISMLWREAGAENEEQFRTLAAQYDRMVHLKREFRQREVILDAIVGEDRREALHQALRHTDADSLRARRNEAQDKLEALQSRITDLHDKRGGLRNEIAKLESGSEHADKLQRLQLQIAAFQQAGEQWGIYALCAELLRAAKEIYEKERQPGVLLHASDYFREITDGRFQRILSPIGSKQIIVEKANGEQLDTAQLSRGTAEQLYLSMRFALADEYDKTVSMPIMMDDIFVNFDQGRFANALHVMKKAAARRQILLFTCHPHMRDAVLNAIPGSQLVEL